MSSDVLRRRFGEPGLIASGQTLHWLSGFVRHDTRGTPSDVPVPRKTILDFTAEIGPELIIREAYRLAGELLVVISQQFAPTLRL